MSKAFTRESDDANEDVIVPVRAALPPGGKNYITPAGASRLREKLAKLSERELSLAASPDQKSRDDARIRQLQEVIDSLVITEPPATDRDVVRFGATVSFRRSNEESTCRIVGVDETDLDRDEISWLSPLAKALLGKRVGDRVKFRAPGGNEELTILAVSYE